MGTIIGATEQLPIMLATGLLGVGLITFTSYTLKEQAPEEHLAILGWGP